MSERTITSETVDELDETEDASEQSDAEVSIDPKNDNEVERAYRERSFRIIYQNHNYFLPQLRDLVENREVLNLRPEYQRRFRWSRKKKAHLVESLLLNVPIPPIYLFENDDARYEVMDGQQRLNAIFEYLNNDFPLSSLDELSFLNGRRYNKLPPALQRGLERSSLSAVVLLQETRSHGHDPYKVRRYVYERLNTGGEKLNPQEVRHSLYRGTFDRMIVSLTRNAKFCKIFGIPVYTETDESKAYENPSRQKNTLYSKMADCQIVLRFFAFKDDEKIVGSVKRMLDRCMEQNQSIDDTQVAAFRAEFEETLDLAFAIFGDEAFVLPREAGGKDRTSIAVYDAVMGALHRSRGAHPKIMAEPEIARAAITAAIIENRALMTGRANTAQSVKDRIRGVQAALERL